MRPRGHVQTSRRECRRPSRWRRPRSLAACLLAAALAVPAMAEARPPIPREKPVPGAEEARRAIGQMVAPESEGDGGDGGAVPFPDRFATPLTGYAPPVLDGAGTPSEERPVLHLVAKLSDEGAPLSSGITWRIFGELPDRDGRLPLVARADGGTASLALRPGRYVVHAAYGRAAMSRLIAIAGDGTSETFVLEAGGLKLGANVAEHTPANGADLSFEIYSPGEFGSEERELLAKVGPNTIVPLPAGPYHVVSRYGSINAIRSADILVSPGKLTSVTMEHRAARVTLRLVSEPGGEALADAAWTVATENGTQLFTFAGAFPSLILAEGKYVATAQHRGATIVEPFEIVGGHNIDVEVLVR